MAQVFPQSCSVPRYRQARDWVPGFSRLTSLSQEKHVAEMELARKRLHWECEILVSMTTNRPVVTGRGDSGERWSQFGVLYHLPVQ